MSKREHSYNSGRITRAGSGQSGQQTAYSPPPAPPKKRKKGKGLIALLIVLAIIATGLGVVYFYLDGIFETGAMGKIINKNYVPKEYKKQDFVHILIVGIDYEEGRNYGGEGLGLTDMILYARFDVKNSKLSMLQIPRDSYVGTEVETGGTGKINALLVSGPDKDNPINNLTDVIEQQFKLPVDHYISMDMEALKIIVDRFGGLKVYVPQPMEHAGSYLDAGWQWMDGNAVEFFVRNRKGEGFNRGDIDRLDNQRHFYSALFRRFMNLTPGDIVKLLPVFDYYCNTDIKLNDIFDLAVSALKLEPENVLFCKVPGVTGLDPMGKGLSTYVVDIYGRGTDEEMGTANLLNSYMRSPEKPYSGEELGLPQITIPPDMTIYPANVQIMSSVQEGEGGTEIDVEPKAE